MRVLFVNSREDAQQNPGGDTIQFSKTKTCLEDLGVKVEILEHLGLRTIPDCDFAHVFNVQTPESTWRICKAIAEKGLPICVSPIYWDVFGLWYENAASNKLFWRLITKLSGRSKARNLYIQWQKRKAPSTTDYQLMQNIVSKASLVLPNSLSEANLLREYLSLGSEFLEKVEVIPNGIETDLYTPQPLPDAGFINKYGIRDFVLEVGRISPVKNQLGLIEALYDLDIPIVFIGQTPDEYKDYADACRSRAAKRGNVLFLDHISHESLPGIYAAARVHALPSWRETPGLASLEAAVAGCKIVTTSIGCTRDYFGEYAWYCDPHNYFSIRSAVVAALEAAPSQELRERILQNYTWRKAGEATHNAYLKHLRRN